MSVYFSTTVGKIKHQMYLDYVIVNVVLVKTNLQSSSENVYTIEKQ